MNYNTLYDILHNKINLTLTDFRGCQHIFWNAFEVNKSHNAPIKSVLELGIYTIKHGSPADLPGQSTKTLMTLGDYYEIDKHVSLDLDDCTDTLKRCTQWCKERGVNIRHNKFVQQNSILFDVAAEFPNGVDFIFLDTNHDDNYPEKPLPHRGGIGHKDSGGAGMTYREICHYAPHLTEHGRLFLHDTNNFYVPKGYGVNTAGAIERFLNENKDFGFKEHMPNNNGLGEIFRKGSCADKIYSIQEKE